jgi:hypothetical protein
LLRVATLKSFSELLHFHFTCFARNSKIFEINEEICLAKRSLKRAAFFRGDSFSADLREFPFFFFAGNWRV